MPIHIRPARRSDLRDIARIYADAFKNHPIDSRIHPYQDQHPHDWFRHSYYTINSCFYEAGWHTYVAEEELSDCDPWPSEGTSSTKMRTLGFAQWFRNGTSPGAQKWQQRDFITGKCDALLTVALMVNESMHITVLRYHYWSWAERLFAFVDRSSDREVEKRYYADNDILVDPTIPDPTEDKHRDYWWLGHLAVTPEAAGRSIGRKLTQWGVERAAGEEVLLGVRCVVSLIPYYRALGFGEVNIRSLQGEPMEEVQLIKYP